MKNRRNLYRVLHVQPDAPTAVIKSSYRTIMQKLKVHPDLGGDDANASLINEAYEVLSNPEKRARYDQLYNPWFKKAVSQESNGYDNRTNPYSEPSSNYRQNNTDGRACCFCRTRNSMEQGNVVKAFCLNCDSPLTAAHLGVQSIDSKRSFQRMSRQGTVTVFPHCGHPGLTGHIRDLSPKGMGFNTNINLETGSVIKIEGDGISAVSRIISCNSLGGLNLRKFAIGVDFITVGFSRAQGTFVYETV